MSVQERLQKETLMESFLGNQVTTPFNKTFEPVGPLAVLTHCYTHLVPRVTGLKLPGSPLCSACTLSLNVNLQSGVRSTSWNWRTWRRSTSFRAAASPSPSTTRRPLRLQVHLSPYLTRIQVFL